MFYSFRVLEHGFERDLVDVRHIAARKENPENPGFERIKFGRSRRVKLHRASSRCSSQERAGANFISISWGVYCSIVVAVLKLSDIFVNICRKMWMRARAEGWAGKR
jgi:hypothetical protein